MPHARTRPDEFPVHQVPQPIAWAGLARTATSTTGPTSTPTIAPGTSSSITGIGYYPNLGVKDAFFLVRRADHPTAVHFSDAIDQDRLNQHVIAYRLEVSEPLRKLRIALDETEGIAVDLTWEGLFDVVQEQPHILRTGNRVTLDAQRFAELDRGRASRRSTARTSPSTPSPDRYPRSLLGYPALRRARAGRPAGRSALRRHVVALLPMAFDDFGIVMIIQEAPSGFRSLNDCTRICSDGRVEQLGWPRVKIHYPLRYPHSDRRHGRGHGR